VSPVERIDGPFVMGHESLAGTLGERREVATTSARAHGVLHPAPAACDRGEMGPPMGREAVEAPCAVVMVEGRVALVRPLAPAAVDDQPARWAGLLEGRPPLVEIGAPLLGLTGRHDCIQDLRGAIGARADDAAQHAARDATPRAVLPPCLACAGRLAFALAPAQRAAGPARAWGFPPPASTGQGQAPHERCGGIEQHAFAPARPLLQGSTCNSALGESSRGGIKSAGATARAEGGFQTRRTRARPS